MSDFEEFSEYLKYDPNTGEITWIKCKSRAVSQNQIAGRITTEGYRQITFNRVGHHAHRVAWLLYTKNWPNNIIDHINGNPLDNRIVNLREATLTENSHNRCVRSDNALNVKGVNKHESGKFRARIWDKQLNRNINLGTFTTLAEAKLAYDTAAKKLYKEFAHV